MYDYSNLKSARDMQRAFDTAAAHMYVKLKSAADKADEAFKRANASRNAQAAYDQALLNAPAPETTQLPATETIAAAPAAPTTTTKYIAPKVTIENNNNNCNKNNNDTDKSSNSSNS
jgi:hypothetical protein